MRKIHVARYIVRYRGAEASLPASDVERIRASVRVADTSDRMLLVEGDEASVRALAASLPSWRVTPEVDIPLPRASRVASRYLSAAEARVKLPKLEGYSYALDAVFSEEDNDAALGWFVAACSPEGAPLDRGLMAHVVGLLQEERQAMEAEVLKEMQKPLRSVVDAYHERDVSLIKTNKTFIKNFDVWLRKLTRSASAEVTPTFVEIWTKAIGEEAAGLDFKDPEDRATFRINVENRMGNLAATMVRALAAKMGAPVGGASGRSVATRAIADAWMKGARP